MTSRNSLGKQIWHNMTRRSWCFALFMIGYFLALPVYAAGRVNNIKMGYMPADMEKELHMLFEKMLFTPTGNLICSVITILAAIICGISGFYYLNVRSQVDLYHSLPIKRAKLLGIRQISGFVLFFVPFLTNLIIAVIIAFSTGNGSKAVICCALKFVIVETVYFLAIYHVTILAMLLTGNILTNVLMTVLLLLGSLVGNFMFGEMRSRFYTTSVMGFSEHYLSPLEDFIFMMLHYENTVDSSKAYEYLFAGTIWKLLIFAIILLGLLFVIYYKRPSEAAGRAIAFPMTEWLVKLVVCVLCSFTGAEMFTMIVQGYSAVWYFGSLFVIFILSNAVCEIIFRADFKEAFRHIWEWGINLAVIALIICGMLFDWTGYDHYQPAESKVESMSFSINAFPIMHGADNESRYYGRRYIRNLDCKMENFHAVYELASIGIANQQKKQPFYVIDSIYWEEELEYLSKEELLNLLERRELDEQYVGVESALFFEVEYHLTNGQNVRRSYLLPSHDEEVEHLISEIFAEPECQMSMYPVMRVEDNADINIVRVDTNAGCQEIELTPEESEALSQALCEDLKEFTYDDLRQEYAIGGLVLYRETEESREEKARNPRYQSYGEYEGEYAIYASFHRTIAFLEEREIAFQLDYDNVTFIEFTVETEDYRFDFDCPDISYADADKAKQQAIYEAMFIRVDTDYRYAGYMNYDQILDVHINWVDNKTGKSHELYSMFKPGEIPDFVYEDLIREIKEMGDK